MATALTDYVLFILARDQQQGKRVHLTYLPYPALYKITSPTLYHESSVRHAVNALERKKLIEKMTKETQTYLTPTDEGFRYIYQQFLQRSQAQVVVSARSWWQVLFDVPESKRALRDTLRESLTGMGFKLWQRSVYLFPAETQYDKEILAALHNPDWYGYIKVMRLSDPILGVTQQDLMDLWKDEVPTQDLQSQLSDMDETYAMLSKRAINNYQKSSYLKKAQQSIYDTFEVLATLPQHPILFQEQSQSPFPLLISKSSKLIDVLVSME